MSYSDILNAVNVYGKTLNKSIADYGNESNKLGDISDDTIYGRTTPTTGPSTFMGSTSRNIYGNQAPSVYDPRSIYQDKDGNWASPDMLTRGTLGLQTGMMAHQISPYASQALQKGYSMVTGKDPITDAVTGEAVGIGPGLSYGMAVKGFTDDRNPYTYTGQERIGDYIGNAMIGSSLAPVIGLTGPVGIGLSALYSIFSSGKKKKKARRLVAQAKEDVRSAQYEGYEDRAEQVAEARDKYLSDASQAEWERSASRYGNQYGGAYNTPDYYGYGEEGMKFSPKEYKKIAKAGRKGDTQLAHINPQEANMLEAMGGSGTINPYTGLPEYHWSFSHVTDTVSDAFSFVGDNIVDPILGGASDVLSAGGDALSEGIDAVVEGGTDIIKGVGDAATDIGRAVTDPIFDLLSGPKYETPSFEIQAEAEAKREAEVIKNKTKNKVNITPNIEVASIKQEKKKDAFQGEAFRGELDNELIRENVMELKNGGLYANINKRKKAGTSRSKSNTTISPENYKKMKEGFDAGGKMNTVAEFTGNELIVNNQSAVEKGISKGNYSMAAAPIRSAMSKGYITPGPETHMGNPMPVDDKGNIYTKGGKLKFKVKKGAGIYDHATDQFRPNMTDKEIAMVAQSNINKWELNGMA